MSSIRHVLETKGKDVFTIGPEQKVLEALEIMAKKDIGALVVVEGKKPVGIFSERDYARKVVLQGKLSRDTPIRDVMTTPIILVEPHRTVEFCMSVMTVKRVRHLPVVESGEMVGLISIGDVVKSIISDKDFVIEQLETYITSGR